MGGNKQQIDRIIDNKLTNVYHYSNSRYFLASLILYKSNTMQAIDRNPKHGITDRVVNTNDNVQILIDLLVIIILSVG